MSVFKPVLQYFATGSDTASCEDFEEYEFPDRLSEETQIVDSFTHCKLQSHALSQYTLATRQNFLSVCRRKLKLLTHLHTVSYNHIRFLNTRTRLVRILASSEYYSITSWIMSEETFFPCKCDIFCFFEFLLLGNSCTAPVFSSIKWINTFT